MKKIAILTQAPVGTNYGSTLQTFALQVFLKRHNYEPTTIDRVRGNDFSVLRTQISILKDELINLFSDRLVITPRIYNKVFKTQFDFVKSNINLSERIDNDLQLAKHFKKHSYDVVIVGSDQVWRPSYSPNIYNYFLDFLSGDKSIKKIAYACSFGTSEWEFSKDEKERCKELVKEFDAVSVREDSGVKLCREFFNIDSTLVLDPTFLLSKDDYVELANSVTTPKRNGLFSYILDENDRIVEILNNLSSLLNLEHYTNQPKWRRNNIEGKSLLELLHPRLENWLKAYEDSDFVVTNSFHGTVFCIIFNKQFLTIVNKGRGAARFSSLLDLFGLTNRMINEEDDFDTLSTILKDQIDFMPINEKLIKLKKFSTEFLIESLKV